MPRSQRDTRARPPDTTREHFDRVTGTEDHLEVHRAQGAFKDTLKSVRTTCKQCLQGGSSQRAIYELTFAQVAGYVAVIHGATRLGKTMASRRYASLKPNV